LVASFKNIARKIVHSQVFDCVNEVEVACWVLMDVRLWSRCICGGGPRR